MATYNPFAWKWHWASCPVLECDMSRADIIISKFGHNPYFIHIYPCFTAKGLVSFRKKSPGQRAYPQ